jgi:hypothetical protein
MICEVQGDISTQKQYLLVQKKKKKKKPLLLQLLQFFHFHLHVSDYSEGVTFDLFFTYILFFPLFVMILDGLLLLLFP